MPVRVELGIITECRRLPHGIERLSVLCTADSAVGANSHGEDAIMHRVYTKQNQSSTAADGTGSRQRG